MELYTGPFTKCTCPICEPPEDPYCPVCENKGYIYILHSDLCREDLCEQCRGCFEEIPCPNCNENGE